MICSRFWQLLLTLLLLRGTVAHAQKEATWWYFGQQVGFDFSGGTPTPLHQSGMRTSHASAVLSDPATGQLLFYSNAEQAWNRQHQIMPHGDSLQGTNYLMQGALALPVPGQAQQYYLFTLKGPGAVFGGSPSALSYSVVDMRLADGLGDVVVARKNVPLAGDYSQQLTAVPHANGRDYWLLAHAWATNRFAVFLVQPTGIQLAHSQQLGAPYPRPDALGYQDLGYLKASPNGRQLVLVSPSPDLPVSLFDFDASTGQLSHYVNLGQVLNAGGVSFSPDNTKLYVQNYSFPVPRPASGERNIISQYDLAAGSDEAIAASAMSIVAGNPTTNIQADAQAGASDYGLQLGLDGRLYANSGYTSPHTPPVAGQQNFFVIAFPNRRGFACGVQAVPFPFSEREDAGVGLPNFLQSAFNGLEAQPEVEPCPQGTLTVYPNPTREYIRLQVPAACFAPYQLVLYNALGQRILQAEVTSALSAEIYLGHLAAGLYLLEARSPTGTRRLKVLKQ